MELSSVDIKNLVFELNNVSSGKIQKVYQTEVYDLILDFYSKNFPFRFFYLKLPSTIVFKNDKVVMPSFPLSLAKRLRSHLNNARILKVEQVNNDRIINFFLEGKNQNYSLILELFSKGNIILLNKYDKIIIIKKQEVFKDRILKPGRIYESPKNKSFKISFEDVKSYFENNSDKHLISLIASLGLGGKYSEKILKFLFKENYKTVTFKDVKDFEKLYFIIEEYFSLKEYFFENDEIFIYNKKIDGEKKVFPNIVEALSSTPLEEKVEEKVKQKKTKKDKKVLIQKKRAEELEKKALEYEEKGKKIFENYVVLKEVLDFVKEYKKKHGSLKDLEKNWPENFPKLKKVDKNNITLILQ